jgi:MazG nucleotide pyrophosphohydrolase domain.
MKTWENHGRMVGEIKKPGVHVLDNLTPERVDLWHAVTGVVTEAGELMDAVKKLVIYNKPLDLENVVEELGDLEFYLEQVRQNIRVGRAIILEKNMEKLGKRYSEGYSDKAAQERADKQGLCGRMDAFSPSGCKNVIPCAAHSLNAS